MMPPPPAASIPAVSYRQDSARAFNAPDLSRTQWNDSNNGIVGLKSTGEDSDNNEMDGDIQYHHSDALADSTNDDEEEQPFLDAATVGAPFLQLSTSTTPRTPPSIDDLAEPVLTVTRRRLDIEIRDDQIIMSTRACFSRPGFIHAVVAFTVSGIVLNTIATFMDYLVRLDGGGQEYVGLVGASFQFVLMISGLIVGKYTDRSRGYYSMTIGMLVLGAFALAECAVSLDSNDGGRLRWSLLVLALIVGPLQPVSTELGVEVAYPLSENTVLVIQQLFSNLLSALFIPFFKAIRMVGTEGLGKSEVYSRPMYTFSFYLLILLHVFATVFFSTFKGRYARCEHEMRTKARLAA